MNLDFAIFANHGTVQQNGLFSVLDGGLEWVSARRFPAPCQNLMLLARLVIAPSECGKEQKCCVAVVAPDGNALKPELYVTFTPTLNARHPERTTTFVGLYNYDRFTFPVPGLYHFRLTVDDITIGETAIEALLEP